MTVFSAKMKRFKIVLAIALTLAFVLSGSYSFASADAGGNQAEAGFASSNVLNEVQIAQNQQVLKSGGSGRNDLFWRTGLFHVEPGQKLFTNVFGRWNFYRSESMDGDSLIESFLVSEAPFDATVVVPENEQIRFAACSTKRTELGDAYIYRYDNIPQEYLLERLEAIEQYLADTQFRAVPDSWGRANTLARAEQLFKLRWTSLYPLTDNIWNQKLSSDKNTVQKFYSFYDSGADAEGVRRITVRSPEYSQNLPYSSGRGHDRSGTGTDMSLYSFMTAVRNPNCDLYHFISPWSNSRLWWGNVCSGFVSYAWGLPCYRNSYLLRNWDRCEVIPLTSLLPGDMIMSPQHLRFIYGIWYDEFRRISYVQYAENDQNGALIRDTMSWEDFVRGAEASGYKAYRYKDIDKVQYEPFPWVQCFDELPPDSLEELYPDYIPREGDRCVFLAGTEYRSYPEWCTETDAQDYNSVAKSQIPGWDANYIYQQDMVSYTPHVTIDRIREMDGFTGYTVQFPNENGSVISSDFVTDTAPDSYTFTLYYPGVYSFTAHRESGDSTCQIMALDCHVRLTISDQRVLLVCSSSNAKPVMLAFDCRTGGMRGDSFDFDEARIKLAETENGLDITEWAATQYANLTASGSELYGLRIALHHDWGNGYWRCQLSDHDRSCLEKLAEAYSINKD